MTEVKTYSYAIGVEIDLDVDQITDLAKRMDNTDREELVEVLTETLDRTNDERHALNELETFIRRYDLGIEERDPVAVIREALVMFGVYA